MSCNSLAAYPLRNFELENKALDLEASDLLQSLFLVAVAFVRCLSDMVT